MLQMTAEMLSNEGSGTNTPGLERSGLGTVKRTLTDHLAGKQRAQLQPPVVCGL